MADLKGAHGPGRRPQYPLSIVQLRRYKEHRNISRRCSTSVSIRIDAFTIDRNRSVLPARGVIEEPKLLAVDRSVRKGIKCLVDTGSNLSYFRTEVARELGLDPDKGKIHELQIDGFSDRLTCCFSRFVLYLDIGPYPTPVPVEFAVVRVRRGKNYEHMWHDDFPKQNILGMKSVLDRRMLCFTPECLLAFENRQ